MEHLRHSILEAETKTGRRLTELRREFNKLAAGKLSKHNYAFKGSWKDVKDGKFIVKGTNIGSEIYRNKNNTKKKKGRTMKEPKSTNRKIRGKDRDHGYGYDVDTCAAACEKDNKDYNKDYKYFALQDGGQCFCAKSSKAYKSWGYNPKNTKDKKYKELDIKNSKFCWKTHKALTKDNKSNYYGARNAQNKSIGLNADPPTRVYPGEGGGPMCNSVYSLKRKSGPTLKDAKEKCYKAGRGALGKPIKNITPEECAVMFPKAEEIAIHALGEEHDDPDDNSTSFGRFECSEIKKRSALVEDTTYSTLKPTTNNRDVATNNIPYAEDQTKFYKKKICAHPTDALDANYNKSATQKKNRIYRILKVTRPKKKTPKKNRSARPKSARVGNKKKSARRKSARRKSSQ